MPVLRLILSATVLLASVRAVELKPETVEAFDRHIAAVEQRLDTRYKSEVPLAPNLKTGSIVLEPGTGNGVIEVKGGLIQDWRGLLFLPATTLERVLSIVQDYNHHHDYYRPEVADAKLRSRSGDDFIVFLRLVKAKLFLTDTLHVENEIHFTHLDANRVRSRSYGTKITEIAEPGKSGEHELPPGKDRGLLWRLTGYWFFEQRDGGVYIECQSVTLTRDVPFGMGKLFSPILRQLPAESVRNALEQTRRAVLALR